MNEEEWREQRAEELKAKTENTPNKEENRAAAERQLDALLSKVLSPEAKTRITNVRMVNAEKYLQTAQVILNMARQGKIQGKISDEDLKQILQQLTPAKKGITIRRK